MVHEFKKTGGREEEGGFQVATNKERGRSEHYNRVKYEVKKYG